MKKLTPNVFDVRSVEEFANKYYKHDRYKGKTAKTGWWDDYADIILASMEQEFKENGYCFISRHESVTGEAVIYDGTRDI